MGDLEKYCDIRDRELNVFDNNSQGKLCKRVCAEIDTSGTGPIPVEVHYEGVGESLYKCSNIPVTANVISSLVLEANVSTLEIRHRDGAEIEWTLNDATLDCFKTIPCGNSYSKQDLRMSGMTLYFRSDEAGVVEITQWS